MAKKKLNSKAVEDERIESVTNKYAARTFNFLVYYLAISIIIKSFTLDVNIFLYYDYALAMVIGGLYMIYRSADKGVAVTPVSVKVFNPGYIKMFAVVSLFMGLFISFVLSGMDDRLAALMPGILEKLAGTIVFGLLFSLIMIAAIWVIDVLPTKMAFRKASELAGEPADELPDDEEVIKQSHVKDERIDSTIEKFAAHALYFLFGYILISTMVKFFIPDLSMIVYYDAFMATMAAGGYFTYKTLRAGVYGQQQVSKKQNVSEWLTFAASCLAFGLFVSFIVFPMDERLAVTLDSFSSKLLLGLIMAVFFGIGMVLFGKLFEWFANKSSDELMESD